MIDLHTHTTASDGRDAPTDLARIAAATGVTVLAATDHDTVSGCDAVKQGCAAAGIRFVTGVEITGTCESLDVHVLGYFFDSQSETLLSFLARQRMGRIERVRRMVDRLKALGIHLDAEAIVRPALEDASKSAGRPWVARALVSAGHAASVGEAFQRWLVPGAPAFVERTGATPEDVVAIVHAAGGVASLAHPGLLGRDDWIPRFVAAGLDAIEAYHTRHDATTTARYLAMANRLGVVVTGGSDYHGDTSHGAAAPGRVALPPEAYARLEDAARKIAWVAPQRTALEGFLPTARASATGPDTSS